MSDATNPQAGVNEVSQDDVSAVAAFLQRTEGGDGQSAQPAPAESQPAAPQAVPPESQAETLTVADLPDEAPVVPVAEQPWAEVEIVHNGQAVKVGTREEAINLMQQGYDFTRKTTALADASRQTQERLTRAAEIEQVQHAVANDLGLVSALQQQLQQYQNVNWMELAQDPQRYAQAQAQYNALGQAYQQAAGALTAKVDAVKQATQQMRVQSLQAEAARLPDLIPEWRDPQKYDAGRNEIAQYLTKSGVDMSTVGERLDNAFAVSMVWKAMQYDKLRAAKADKTKQLRSVPPVSRPGAAQGADAANADRTEQLTKRFHKTGSDLDAAALLVSRMK